MAVLRRLKADGLRNLRGVDLGLETGTTILEGPNGAGKTALIEAAYLLGRGRSFRGRRHGPLVDRARAGAAVEGWIESAGIIERLHWESRGEMGGPGARADGAAPEVVLGVELDGRADVYALAGTIYNVTTGRAFFDEISEPRERIVAHMRMDPLENAQLSGYPAPQVKLMRTATALEWKDRPTPLEFGREFDQAL